MEMHSKMPNKRPAMDAAIACGLHVVRLWRGATEAGR